MPNSATEFIISASVHFSSFKKLADQRVKGNKMLIFLPLIFLQIELVSHLEDYQRSEEEKEAMERQHKVIRRLGASLGCLLGMIYITAY